MNTRFCSLSLVTVGLLLVPALLPQSIPFTASSALAQATVAQTAQDADALFQQGLQYLNDNQWEAAWEHLTQALNIRNQLGDRPGAANVLNSMGTLYLRQGQYNSALEYYQKAFELVREPLNRPGAGVILNNIGLTYAQLGENQAAIDTYQQALSIYQELADDANIAITLNNLGALYTTANQYQTARATYQQALTIYEATNDRSGMASVLNNIGETYRYESQYSQALSYYEQALAIFRALDNQQQIGTTLHNIGTISLALGQDEQAQQYYQEALSIAQEIQDYASEANVLNSLGSVERKRSNYSQALEYYQQALGLAQAVGDPDLEQTILNNIGSVYSQLDQSPQALQFYQQALEWAKSLGDQGAEAIALNNIGAVYASQQQYDQAIESYQQALERQNAIGDRAGAAHTLSNIADVWAEQNKPELAIVLYKQSVNLTEAIRKDLQTLTQEQQESYTQTVADRYRTLADLLLQQDRIAEAQQVLDLLKLQELQDYLGDVRGNEQTQQGLEYWQSEQQLIDLYNQAVEQGQDLTDWENLPEVSQFIEQLSRSTQQQNPVFSNFTALQQTLQNQPNTVLLYPLILDDRLELVLVTPNSPPIRRTVAVSREELNRTIVKFRTELSPLGGGTTAAQQLYQWLIQPIEADLAEAGAKTILYAPDATLRYIPLAALYDGQQWLIQRFQVNYITAASLTQFDRPRQPELRVLAGAFTQGNYELQVGTRQFEFAGLPFAKVEVETIATEIPNTTSLFDQDFNRASVETQMNNYSIVHLATHAQFLPGVPEDSFILFGNGDRATLRDVANWSLPNVDLVVLSACETAVGTDLGSGEEILGFGYQIEQTGARAAIASLWSVNDGGTQQLMNAFYAALDRGNISKAEALRQAQIALITGDFSALGLPADSNSADAHDFRQPYYWAPFILIGNGL